MTIDESIAVKPDNICRETRNKQDVWEESGFGHEIKALIHELNILRLRGNGKSNVDWIIKRLEDLSYAGYNMWCELQEEKAKPKWIETKLTEEK